MYSNLSYNIWEALTGVIIIKHNFKIQFLSIKHGGFPKYIYLLPFPKLHKVTAKNNKKSIIQQRQRENKEDEE